MYVCSTPRSNVSQSKINHNFIQAHTHSTSIAYSYLLFRTCFASEKVRSHRSLQSLFMAKYITANIAFSACLSKHNMNYIYAKTVSFIHTAPHTTYILHLGHPVNCSTFTVCGMCLCTRIWIDFHKTLNEIVIGWGGSWVVALALPPVAFIQIRYAYPISLRYMNFVVCIE